MKRLLRISILALGIVVFSPPVAKSAEQEVLQALEAVRAGIQDEVPYGELAELIEAAQVQVYLIKKGDTSDCFRIAVKRSHYWYRLGIKSWETLIHNQQERDVQAKRINSEYWDDDMKAISLKMVENYDKLIQHAEEALPSKWEHGNAALDRAHECLKPQK